MAINQRTSQDEINASSAIRAAKPSLKIPTFTALPQQQGIGTNELITFDEMTFAGVAGIRDASGPDTSSQRRGLGNQLKFGLQGIGLDREELALNRRDSQEAAINNALQRGIFQSGIRIRNEQRVGERADLAGRRLDLSEKELRANISNALAGLKEEAANQKRQQEIDFEQARRMLRDQTIIERGGEFASVGRDVVRDQREGGVF